SSDRCDAPASCQPVMMPVTTRGGRSTPSTSSVQPLPARTVPASVAADSIARVAVVPTAITRRRFARVRLTRWAVPGGTANRSGAGGSPGSAEETPACSVMGAIATPELTSDATNSVLKGRAALAISALPGTVAKTVWYAESGQAAGT